VDGDGLEDIVTARCQWLEQWCCAKHAHLVIGLGDVSNNICGYASWFDRTTSGWIILAAMSSHVVVSIC
jgi:hypothetical protein